MTKVDPPRTRTRTVRAKVRRRCLGFLGGGGGVEPGPDLVDEPDEAGEDVGATMGETGMEVVPAAAATGGGDKGEEGGGTTVVAALTSAELANRAIGPAEICLERTRWEDPLAGARDGERCQPGMLCYRRSAVTHQPCELAAGRSIVSVRLGEEMVQEKASSDFRRPIRTRRDRFTILLVSRSCNHRRDILNTLVHQTNLPLLPCLSKRPALRPSPIDISSERLRSA
jgi:hypothetical protein